MAASIDKCNPTGPTNNEYEDFKMKINEEPEPVLPETTESEILTNTKLDRSLCLTSTSGSGEVSNTPTVEKSKSAFETLDETNISHECEARSLSSRVSVTTRDVDKLLKKDLFACDLLWCLFVAAAKSYRFSSILRPFPAMYQTEEGKDMFSLKSVISSMPKLSRSSEFLSDLSNDSRRLLSWLFNAGKFTLKHCEKNSTMKVVKELTGQVLDTPEPSYIFEVVHNEANNNKFESLQNGRACLYAYHGSRLDNFFSILHNGLNTNLNKVSVFGEGTYLSSELSVSLPYSQGGEVAATSYLGTKLSCVAVCEMIDDPSVKCQTKEGSALQQRKRAQASKTTDYVPEKYYVVQRNDVIRVKYLLIYKENGSKPQDKQARQPSWVWEHKFLLMMIAYVILLMAIGMANSRQTKIFMDKFWKLLKFK